MTKARQAYPTDLHDNEGNVLAPDLPPAQSPGRPRQHAWREILKALFSSVRSGCAWRLLPPDFPPWKTVDTDFRRWRVDGPWAPRPTAVREALRMRAGRHPQPRAAILDSQTVTPAEGGPARGDDAGTKTARRKRPVVVDSLGLLVLVVVTAGTVHDRDGAKQLLGAVVSRLPLAPTVRWWRLQLSWAAGGDRGAVIDWVRRTLGWTLELVAKLRAPGGCQVLPKRGIVERTVAWLHRQRRWSNDDERLPQTREAVV